MKRSWTFGLWSITTYLSHLNYRMTFFTWVSPKTINSFCQFSKMKGKSTFGTITLAKYLQTESHKISALMWLSIIANKTLEQFLRENKTAFLWSIKKEMNKLKYIWETKFYPPFQTVKIKFQSIDLNRLKSGYPWITMIKLRKETQYKIPSRFPFLSSWTLKTLTKKRRKFSRK